MILLNLKGITRKKKLYSPKCDITIYWVDNHISSNIGQVITFWKYDIPIVNKDNRRLSNFTFWGQSHITPKDHLKAIKIGVIFHDKDSTLFKKLTDKITRKSMISLQNTIIINVKPHVKNKNLKSYFQHSQNFNNIT